MGRDLHRGCPHVPSTSAESVGSETVEIIVDKVEGKGRVLELSPAQREATSVELRTNGRLPQTFWFLEIIFQLLIISELYLYVFSDPRQDVSSLRDLDALPNWK